MNKEIIEEAITKAIDVRKNAYAPYSNFAVGAALVTTDGKIFLGVNVENSSFGATVCAERNALFSAITEGYRKFDTIVIASDLNGKAVPPCGICRQVLADFAPEINVILVNSTTKLVEQEMPLSQIFPQTFNF